jgi:hypothetical protein
MPIYTDVFGGANIYPSEISFSAITLTSTDVTLSWPEETSTNTNLATRIIDVTATTAGRSIFLPDAQKSGVGNTILFNNQGAETFVVKNAGGTQVVSIASGTVWQVYLTNNTTTNGLWETLQFGATVSNANASALAGTGIVAVGTLLSQSVPITQFNSNYIAGDSDRAKMYLWTGSGSGTLTLPSAASVGNNWFMYLRNAGGGQVTVTPSGVNTIDGLATKAYQPTESSVIISDGTNFYTLGFGQASVFVFDYTVISVAGTGTYTLAGSELNRIVYKFTGVLTGNRIVVVPATVQQYWVDNATTGAYTLTVKTSAGTGAVVNQGSRGIYYCDGTDVVDADTASVSFPISIAQGGTGATTAGGALINLGGTAVGIPIFEAANQQAAWTALGIAPAGVVVGGTF